MLELGIKERNTKQFSLDLSNSVHFLEIKSTWRYVRMNLSRILLLLFLVHRDKTAEQCYVIEKDAFHTLTGCWSKSNLAAPNTLKLGFFHMGLKFKVT